MSNLHSEVASLSLHEGRMSMNARAGDQALCGTRTRECRTEIACHRDRNVEVGHIRDHALLAADHAVAGAGQGLMATSLATARYLICRAAQARLTRLQLLSLQ